VNFVTHLRGRDRPLFRTTDDELLSRYRDDFRAVFGLELEPFWTQVTRVPMYSPVFGPSYHNPPVRSASWENVYFAGNYRTFPSIVSTGTALGSGLETAEVLLRDLGARSTLPATAAAFRLGKMTRG
jgi:protoporphyrinogen oxidase